MRDRPFFSSMKTRHTAVWTELRAKAAALEARRTTGTYHATAVRKAAGRTSRGATGRRGRRRLRSWRRQKTAARIPATWNLRLAACATATVVREGAAGVDATRRP